jgi:acylphosphatase
MVRGVVRRRVVVEGRVQGVGYRATCARLAQAAGVGGTVRNLPDGRVEAVLEGPPEEVHALVDWAHRGPDAATVTEVAVREERPEGLGGFAIR